MFAIQYGTALAQVTFMKCMQYSLGSFLSDKGWV